jgi:molybdenum cofactor guanylyltransferase
VAPLGAILAGGSNRRFGGNPKGLEQVGGARILDRVRSALAPACSETVLLANVPSARDWLPGMRIVPDVHAGTGGLAGVHAALCLGQDVLVVAWDMPFVTSELLQGIVDAARAADAMVCAPESPSHGLEPFCAFYRHDVAAPLARYLEGGGGSARDFLVRCDLRLLPLGQVARFGDPTLLLMSVNTAEELERARAIA